MNLNKIKMTMATGVLAASMILPGMTAFAAPKTTVTGGTTDFIVKTVKSPEGVSYTNQTFSYTFEQDGYQTVDGSKTFVGGTDDSGVKANLVEASIPGVSTSAMASNKNNVTNGVDTETAKVSISLENITVPGVYTYTVKETARTTTQTSEGVNEANGTTWKYDVTTYKLRVYVTKDATTGALTKTMTLVDSSKDTDDDKVATADFTNLVTKRGGSGDGEDSDNGPTPGTDKAALTISKALATGDAAYEPTNQTYAFTVNFTENDLNTADDGLDKDNTYEYYIVSADGTRGSVQTINNGETISLKNGEKAEFYKIYAGTTVVVTETGKDKDGNTIKNLKEVKAKVTSNDETKNAGTNALTKTDAGYATSSFVIGEGTNSAEFTNDFSDVTVTGVVTNVAPYITLVVVAVAAVAAYMGLKSRIAR